MQEVDRLGWAATVPLRAGEHVLGIRSNTHAFASLLGRLFPDRLVVAAQPPPNLSAYVAPQSRGGTQEVHRLYLNCTRILRTRSVRRVLEALWHELDARDVRLAAELRLVDAVALVREGEAHLVPQNYRRAIVDDERRWSKAGFAVVDRRWLAFDAEKGTVTIPAPPVTIHGVSLDVIRADDHPEPPRPTGVLPISSWTLAARALSPAAGLVTAVGQVLDVQAHGGLQLVSQLAELLERLPGAPDQPWSGMDGLRERLGST